MTFKCANPKCNKAYKTSKSLSMHLAQKRKCQAVYFSNINFSCFDVTSKAAKELGNEMLCKQIQQLQQYEISGSFFETNQVDDSSTTATSTSTINVTRDPEIEIIRDDEKPPFIFTKERKIEVKLLKLLNEIGAPLYAFDLIMQWAFEAYSIGYDFNPTTKRHSTQLTTLQEITNMSNI